MRVEYPILIVDDDPVVRAILDAYLRGRTSVPVHQAKDGKSALKLVSNGEHPIGLIVLDIEMPELNGIEVLMQLQSCEYEGEIVIVSGAHNANLESARKLAAAYGLKLAGVIRKPVSRRELDACFGSILANPAVDLEAGAQIDVEANHCRNVM